MSVRLVVMAWVSLLTLLVSRPAEAGPPTDQLKNRVDRVIQILDDPRMKQDARTAERRAAIRAIANELFDFTEISKRSLARHWLPRTPVEREEFTRLFGDLLEHAYVSKIELYSGEKILYLGELLDGDQATVRTRIVSKQGPEVPVDYRMLREGSQWRAYDVLIEGVSLVSNYRTQFNSVIQRTSYADLVKALRTKRDEASRKPAATHAATSSSTESPAPGPSRSQTP